MGRTYRRGRIPLKEVKRIVLEHCGSESYVNELNEDELRNLADEIEYSNLIQRLRGITERRSRAYRQME